MSSNKWLNQVNHQGLNFANAAAAAALPACLFDLQCLSSFYFVLAVALFLRATLFRVVFLSTGFSFAV